MPDEKNKLSRPERKRVRRQLLTSMAIKDLPCARVVSVTSLQPDDEPSPSQYRTCAHNEEDTASPGACYCCERQCGEIKGSPPVQESKTATCAPKCKSLELKAVIDEMESCRDIIRTLVVEARDIIHPQTSEQDCSKGKKNRQAQKEPKPNEKECYCEHCKDLEANLTEPANGKYSGSERQSKTQYHAMPPIPQKSPTPSRKSSTPIAQTAFQIKDSRLLKGKKDCVCDEEKLKKKSDCKTSFYKLFGKTPSDNERSVSKTDSKTQGSQKTSESNIKVDCNCEDKEKQNEDKKGDSKSVKKKIAGEPNDDEREQKTVGKQALERKNSNTPHVVIGQMENQNRVSEKEKRKSTSVAMTTPACTTNTCSCRFPPAFNQYINCTGHVVGNCHCDKNV